MIGGIYVLIDPRDGAIRYVGQSDNFKTRRQWYRNVPKGRRPLSLWVRQLADIGTFPLFVPVEITDHGMIRDNRERAWIRVLSSTIGLLNIEDGGRDRTGRAHSDETKTRMRGRVPWNKGIRMSEHSRSLMSAAKRGKSLTDVHKQRIAAAGKGRVLSAETRSKISTSHLGISPDKATRARIAATLKGRKASEGTREKLRRAQQARRLVERSRNPDGRCDRPKGGFS